VTVPQFYDPRKLVTEVQDLLQAHGVEAQMQDWLLADEGASKLLRGIGVIPALDPVEGVVHAVAEPWTDTDDRRAARYPVDK
jgi:hypothetical protein